jgi:DNA segregation ATPase FtsK/SpoIIIE-like protein
MKRYDIKRCKEYNPKLLRQAKKMIYLQKVKSASYLQRKLQIGYSRAVDIIECLTKQYRKIDYNSKKNR